MLAVLAAGPSALAGPALAPAQQLRSSRPRLCAPVTVDAVVVQPSAGSSCSSEPVLPPSEPVLPPKRDAPRLETLLITGPKARAESRKRQHSYPDVPSLRKCLRFAIPALGIYCAGPLMSLIDAAFVGRASSLQLASLGPASSISDSAPVPLLFLSMGATNLVARAHGRSRAASAVCLTGCSDSRRTPLDVGSVTIRFSRIDAEPETRGA